MEKIGIIGLGNMGMGIAKNVINNAYRHAALEAMSTPPILKQNHN